MARQLSTNKTQTFAYIQSMLTEMRMLSETEDAPMLAYLIEMAIIEADDLVEGVHVEHPGIAHRLKIAPNLEKTPA